jgi:transaldolase/glucose-6-phosphate isomerase
MPAITRLLAEGVNVNVTLIFGLSGYEAVLTAWLEGLERLVSNGGNPGLVASVASFFVSRVDGKVDAALEERGHKDLQGTIAIANARMAYARFRKLLGTPRWQALAAKGAQPQRLLWASTSTKNPDYSDTMYVDELIGAQTVNTVPPATLDLFLDHGTVNDTLGIGLDDARERLGHLAELGINLTTLTEELLDEGVASFAASFVSLRESIARKRKVLAATMPRPFMAWLGELEPVVERGTAELASQKVMRRIWAHDHTVWNPDPREIENRLGWLVAPDMMEGQVGRLETFAATVRSEGFADALLLGMGGSSLAPEALASIFGPDAPKGSLRLTIIDSTDPDCIRRRTGTLDLARTLVIVATKSGGTAETLSAFRYMYNAMQAAGVKKVGQHFIAITDPGSGLETLATEYSFRETFLNDPTVGGRYAALTWFGLVPAVLSGVAVDRLLDRASTAACNAASANCPHGADNHAGRLGVILGDLARAGRDKLTITTTPGLEGLADWIEQLVAESTGKNGVGIVPVVREPLGTPAVYGKDRLFVDIRLAEDPERTRELTALRDAGHPVVQLTLNDRYDVGAQFFLWEMATVVAGHRLGIHPFDQPNVEAAKIVARTLVDAYLESGTLPPSSRVAATPEAVRTLLDSNRPGDYVAIQAYLDPAPDTDRILSDFRVAIRDRYRLATTLGYGPRFLHSTGQLHKGDGGNGLFVQITSEEVPDLGIPDRAGEPESTMGFQVLKVAQAAGDAQALLDAGRRVAELSVPAAPGAALQALADGVS